MMRNYYLMLVLVAVILLLPSISFAGYFYAGGVCYDNAQLAFNAFISQYPRVDGLYQINYGSPYPTVTDLGVVTINYVTRNIQTGALTFGPQFSFSLISCDSTQGTLNAYPVQDILFALGLVLIWAIGFKGGLTR